jgi:hypothetical protein
MVRKSTILVLAVSMPLCCLVGLESEALGQTIAPANKPCHQEYAKYRKDPEHKAFVISAARHPQQACGRAWGYPTKKAAIDQAFVECAIAARRGKIPKKSCRLMTAK